MWRMIGVLIALGLVAWLSMTQLDGAGRSASQAAEAAAEMAGADGDDALKIDPGSSPEQIAAQVGRQVEATLAAGKTRVDDGESEASDGPARDGESSDEP
jgi:hypothetical protein